jgi:integrase
MKHHAERYFSSDFLGRQETTIRAHRLWLNKFFDHVGKRIDARSYADWVRHSFVTWGDRTARNFAIASASRFLTWCERQGLIEKSPHRLVRLPEPQQHDPREPFSEGEYTQLLTVADSDDPDLAWAIRLGWECGTAIADACLLQWSAVDLSEAVLKLRRRKTGEPCLIPLAKDGAVMGGLWDLSALPRTAEWPNKPPEIIYVLPRLAADYLVALKSGSVGLQKRFAAVRTKALPDCQKSFHSLRASFCSALANGGMNLAAACRLSGHKDPRIFQQYVTADIDQLRDQMLKARQAG